MRYSSDESREWYAKESRESQIRGHAVEIEYHKTRIQDLEQRIEELERRNLVDEAWKERTENDPIR